MKIILLLYFSILINGDNICDKGFEGFSACEDINAECIPNTTENENSSFECKCRENFEYNVEGKCKEMKVCNPNSFEYKFCSSKHAQCQKNGSEDGFTCICEEGKIEIDDVCSDPLETSPEYSTSFISTEITITKQSTTKVASSPEPSTILSSSEANTKNTVTKKFTTKATTSPESSTTSSSSEAHTDNTVTKKFTTKASIFLESSTASSTSGAKVDNTESVISTVTSTEKLLHENSTSSLKNSGKRGKSTLILALGIALGILIIIIILTALIIVRIRRNNLINR